MNKQEQALNAQSKLMRILNIRKNHLIQLEQELANDITNNELIIKVQSYRLFVAKEQANMDKLFAKMGWN
jgi:hypothetical protein